MVGLWVLLGALIVANCLVVETVKHTTCDIADSSGCQLDVASGRTTQVAKFDHYER